MTSSLPASRHVGCTSWWRYPTGTKAVTDIQEQHRVIRRRFEIGN